MVFLKDPCGIVCLIFTYLAVLYADYVVVRWIILETMPDSLWGSVNAVIFNVILFLLLMAHIRAVFSDPGVVPLPRNRIDFSDIHSSKKNSCAHTDWTVCTRCETYRPPRAHHCCICQRCIRRMDHHCPWINNCVGERNQKYFMQFLLYVGVLCIYALGLLVFSWIRECDQCGTSIAVKQARMMHSVILLIESALFGLFVTIILINQIQAIFEDETTVEQTHNLGSFRPHKPKYALLSEVCGRQHPLLWLFPCASVSKKFDTPLIDYHV